MGVVGYRKSGLTIDQLTVGLPSSLDTALCVQGESTGFSKAAKLPFQLQSYVELPCMKLVKRAALAGVGPPIWMLPTAPEALLTE